MQRTGKLNAGRRARLVLLEHLRLDVQCGLVAVSSRRAWRCSSCTWPRRAMEVITVTARVCLAAAARERSGAGEKRKRFKL